jgi:hypothetical protein
MARKKQGRNAAPESDRHSQDGESDQNHGYAVGYRRPPKHTRFKPGQSGNPKGRKKGTINLNTVLKKVLNEDVLIREGGRQRRMPKLEALVRNTLAQAFKGDPKAYASLGLLMRQSGYGNDPDEVTAENLLGANYQHIVDDFLARAKTSEKWIESEIEQGEQDGVSRGGDPVS